MSAGGAAARRRPGKKRATRRRARRRKLPIRKGARLRITSASRSKTRAGARNDIRLIRPKRTFPTSRAAWESIFKSTGFSQGEVTAAHTPKAWRWFIK